MKAESATHLERLDSSQRPSRFIILADDLTGAADSAVALAGADGEATVLLDPGLAMDAPTSIVALDLDTRSMHADQAYACVAHAANRIPPDVGVFKKIDSTLRGHIGAELTALAAAMSGPALCIVAPAHPELGRTQENGRLIIHGMDADPATLWPDGKGGFQHGISTALTEHGFDCLDIGLAELRRDTVGDLALIMKRAMHHAKPAVICDAQTTSDLRRIAEAALNLDLRCIMVGSAGLAQALQEVMQDSPVPPPMPASLNMLGGGTLFLAGSYSAAAAEQVHQLAAQANVEHLALAVDALLTRIANKDAERIDNALSQGKDLLLSISTQDGVQSDISRALAKGMARIAAPLVPRMAAVVCCGGDTSRALLTELGAHALQVRRSGEAGATLAWADVAPDRLLVLKAGAFGDAKVLLRLRELLTTAPSRTHPIDS